MFDVDTYTDGLKPTLKTNLRKPLVIKDYKEYVSYRIINRKKELLEFDKVIEISPQIGESLQIHYDFSPRDGCIHGWERLSVFVYRLDSVGRNYVRYFKNIKTLEKYLSNFTLKIDKKFARDQIKELKKEIAMYEKNYELQ